MIVDLSKSLESAQDNFNSRCLSPLHGLNLGFSQKGVFNSSGARPFLIGFQLLKHQGPDHFWSVFLASNFLIGFPTSRGLTSLSSFILRESKCKRPIFHPKIRAWHEIEIICQSDHFSMEMICQIDHVDRWIDWLVYCFISRSRSYTDN